GTDASETVSYPDGSTATLVHGPDPRWGMQAPFVAQLAYTPAGGTTSTALGTRTAKLTTATDPFSLDTLTDQLAVAGRTTSVVYDAHTRAFTRASPTGHTASSQLDTSGRLATASLDPS